MYIDAPAVVDPKRKYKSVAELSRGILGDLSVGQGKGRVVLLRQLRDLAPWNPNLLDALAASAERAKVHHHPRLLAVMDVERAVSDLIIATEYVEGVPLALLMQRAQDRRIRVPTSAILRLAEELTRGILALEEMCAGSAPPWVFGGLNPETVIITSGDDALIADVGVIGFEPSVGVPSLLAYRAPELGHTSATNSAAVFSIGVMLWELLSGHDAFGQNAPDATPASIRNKVVAGAAPRLDRVAADVPPLLKEVVMQAIRPDPGKRFPTVQALSHALAAVRADRGSGELMRFMNGLATDVLENQRGSIVRGHVSVDSWRPTVAGTESQAPVVIPKAPRLMGLAAFVPKDGKPDSRSDSARAIDSLLDGASKVAPMRVEVPATARLGAPRSAMGTTPLLLVNKPQDGADAAQPAAEQPAPPGANEQPPEVAGDLASALRQAGASAMPAPAQVVETRPQIPEIPILSTASDEEIFVPPPPRRRWGLIIFVVFALLGAVAIGVFAVLKQQEQSDTEAMPVPAAAVTAGAAEKNQDANSEADAAADSATKAAKRPKRRGPHQPRVALDPSGQPIDGTSILDHPDASVGAGAAGGPSDNPYDEKGSAPPAASVDPALGY